jgi:eukaryotic-like serine/threonine-protein kinase
VSPLGAGGMGEVYRARDTKLGRVVAIKVLPDAFTADPERVPRFEREAKVLASLNHPNIASLFGMDQEGERHFLVMELVEGDTLSERLQRRRMPIDEVLRIAFQIADALETAHEQGIVHRDLKPANIKITPDEKVKVLDFGLAKAMETAPPDGKLVVIASPSTQENSTERRPPIQISVVINWFEELKAKVPVGP